MKKKNGVFFTAALVFSTWRPSPNTVFYNTKATFSFSMFYHFFLKIVKKVFQNLIQFFPFKKLLKSRTRQPFWVPKWFQIHVGRVKKLENSPKKSFLDRAVCQTFFELQKALIRARLEDPSPAGRPQTLKTDSEDLAGSGTIWSWIFGIIRSCQLPLALRLPNPLITR